MWSITLSWLLLVCNNPKLHGMKPPSFNFGQRFCRSENWVGHSSDGVSLLRDVWNLTWEDSEIGDYSMAGYWLIWRLLHLHVQAGDSKAKNGLASSQHRGLRLVQPMRWLEVLSTSILANTSALTLLFMALPQMSRSVTHTVYYSLKQAQVFTESRGRDGDSISQPEEYQRILRLCFKITTSLFTEIH